MSINSALDEVIYTLTAASLDLAIYSEKNSKTRRVEGLLLYYVRYDCISLTRNEEGPAAAIFNGRGKADSIRPKV